MAHIRYLGYDGVMAWVVGACIAGGVYVLGAVHLYKAGFNEAFCVAVYVTGVVVLLAVWTHMASHRHM